MQFNLNGSNNIHSCLTENLSPKSIRNKPLLQTRIFFVAVKQFQKKMLRAIIDDCYQNIASYQSMKEASRVRCTTTLSKEHFSALEETPALEKSMHRIEKVKS